MERYKTEGFEYDDISGCDVALDIIENKDGEYVKYEDVKPLIKALKKYGQHFDDCNLWVGFIFDKNYRRLSVSNDDECTCGLDEALKQIEE